jgi:hypothetical protein
MKPDPDNNFAARRINRREAIRWVAMASASTAFFSSHPFSISASPQVAKSHGYGVDPVLFDTYEVYHSGTFWPLTLKPAQRRTLGALCDLMIPADKKSPGASAVGVPDFVDEWISAPYPAQQTDCPVVLDGLKWLEDESQRRFKRDFPNLSATQQSEMADDICSIDKAKPEFHDAAHSFTRLRSLIVGAYYTTPAGMKDLGFVGNVALAAFPKVPREVLEKLGLI